MTYHALAAADLMKLCAYPTLLFLGLSIVTCGILTVWPAFRTPKALLRVCVVIAAGVLAVTAWSNSRPQTAVATPIDAAATAQGPTPVQEMPSSSVLMKGGATTRPLPATVMDIEGRSYLVAELPKGTARVSRKASTQPARSPTTALGPAYMDEVNGFAVRFPAGWQIKTFVNSGNWILDASDGRDALISVGFAPFPKDVRADQIKPELMAESIRSQPQTTLHGMGLGAVDGRKALWAHSTGPLQMTDASPRMTRVHYLVPLQDGRALELRLAARPEKYEQMSGLMKQAAESFKLLPRRAAATK
jgi:hypothetical protein